GGLKGYAQDGLRVLQVAGPAAKLSRFTLAKVLADAPGGVCTWVSATKALRQMGVKHLATLADLARAHGVPVEALGGAFVDEVIPAMRQLGARVENLGEATSFEAVKNAAARGKGVVLFSVEWANAAGRQVGHTLYAYRNTFGQLRIADRTGKIVSSLAE